VSPVVEQSVTREMFGGEDTRANAINVSLDGLDQSFFEQRAGARKKLNRPSGDHDIFTFCSAAFGFQVIVNQFRTNDRLARISLERDKDVHIQGGHRLEIKCCANRTADRVTVDDAVGQHTIDDFDNFSYAHARRNFAEKAEVERESAGGGVISQYRNCKVETLTVTSDL